MRNREERHTGMAELGADRAAELVWRISKSINAKECGTYVWSVWKKWQNRKARSDDAKLKGKEQTAKHQSLKSGVKRTWKPKRICLSTEAIRVTGVIQQNPTSGLVGSWRRFEEISQKLSCSWKLSEVQILKWAVEYPKKKIYYGMEHLKMLLCLTMKRPNSIHERNLK